MNPHIPSGGAVGVGSGALLGVILWIIGVIIIRRLNRVAWQMAAFHFPYLFLQPLLLLIKLKRLIYLTVYRCNLVEQLVVTDLELLYHLTLLRFYQFAFFFTHKGDCVVTPNEKS